MLDVSRLLNLPATLTTVTVDGVDGNMDPNEVTVDTEIRCWVHPDTSEEAQGLTERRFVGYFLPDQTIGADDRLTLGAATYEFDGLPEPWTHPLDAEVKYQTARLVRTA